MKQLGGMEVGAYLYSFVVMDTRLHHTDYCQHTSSASMKLVTKK